MPKWLRVVVIIVICLVILLVSGFMFLFWAFGGLQRLDLNHPENLAYVAGYILLLGGGIFGIVALIRRPRTNSPEQALAEAELAAQPLPEPNPEKVQWLNFALMGQIVLAALLPIYTLVTRHASGVPLLSPRVLMLLVLTFVIYQTPYGIVLLGLSQKIGRIYLAITLTLPWAFVLHSAYYILTYLHAYAEEGPRTFVPLLLVPAADIAVFIFALQLRAQLGRNKAPLLVVTAVLSLVYVLGATFVLTLLREWIFFHRI